MTTTYHVGIDLHKKSAQICVLDAEGEVHRERRWPLCTSADGDALLAWLTGFGDGGRFAVEALGCNRWFVDGCRELGLDVIVADASKLDLKKLGRKTDRRDAREIARRLYLGDLERFAKSYYATDEEYGQRKLLRLRRNQVARRTGAIAQIRGLLNAYLIRPPMRTLSTKSGIAWLRAQTLANEELSFVLEVLVDDLENLERQIAALSARVEARAREDETARVLRDQLPQVGFQTALTLRAELGDATRFDHAREVACYAGLVPKVTASADRAHHGPITRRGNVALRWIVGQWAVRMLAFDARVRAWAGPMLRRMHKNKVRMALARRLLVGVWMMLKHGVAFSLEACLGARA